MEMRERETMSNRCLIGSTLHEVQSSFFFFFFFSDLFFFSAGDLSFIRFYCIHSKSVSLRRMLLFNIDRSMFVLVSLLLLCVSTLINGKPIEKRDLSVDKSKSAEYKRLASYCYIDDYSAWLQRQQELVMWLDLANILKLPIHEDEQFQQEVQQYRLQHECLRVMERLPVSVGPG